MKRFFAAWMFAVYVCCCVESASAQTLSDPGLSLTTVLNSAAGLSQPTGLRFLGSNPNDFFAIEKNTGRVKRFQSGVSTTVIDLPVASESERGLLGIALHPNFGEIGQPLNDKVYLYYSRSSSGGDSSSGNWLENRLSRFSWNGSSLTGEQVLATFGKSNDGRASGPNHNGGPIKFGPDGRLYGITGDLNRNLAEQNNKGQANNSSRVGAIYRIADNGAIPPDNPFANSSTSSFRRVYAYGVRNSFGIDFDPATGRLWDTENGPSAYDEINRVFPGFNSGWKDIMGPNSRSPGTTSDLVKINSNAAYSDPEFSWKSPIAATAINFLHGSDLGAAYDNKVLVGDANFGNLYMFTLNAGRSGFILPGGLSDLVADTTAERNQMRIGQGFGVTTDIVRGPDDNTYVLNFLSGEVYRIEAAMGAVASEPATAGLALLACCAVVVCKRRRKKAKPSRNS
jgi:aldose sugar dehydrogenase